MPWNHGSTDYQHRYKMKAVINESERELVGNLKVADSFFSRLKGLFGTKKFVYGDGLWLKPCKSVHTFGMKFSIDVVMLDEDNRVVAMISELKPNRVSSMHPHTATILELPAHSIIRSGLTTGDSIVMTI